MNTVIQTCCVGNYRIFGEKIKKFLHPGDLFAGITAPQVRLEGTTLEGNTINDCEGYLINGPNNSIGNPARCNLQNP